MTRRDASPCQSLINSLLASVVIKNKTIGVCDIQGFPYPVHGKLGWGGGVGGGEWRKEKKKVSES